MCVRLDTGFAVVCYYMPLLKICCVNTITLFMRCNQQQLSSNSVSGYSDRLGAVDRVVSAEITYCYAKDYTLQQLKQHTTLQQPNNSNQQLFLQHRERPVLSVLHQIVCFFFSADSSCSTNGQGVSKHNQVVKRFLLLIMIVQTDQPVPKLCERSDNFISGLVCQRKIRKSQACDVKKGFERY